DRSFARPPHFESALDLVGLMNPFLDYCSWLQKYAHLLQALRNLHHELRIVHVVFGEISVTQVDAAFVVGVVGSHIVRTDDVINAFSGAAHSRDNVIAWFEFSDILAYGFHLPEAFVPDHQEVISRRGSTIFGGIDLFICAIHAHAQHFYQHASPVWNLV